jgi:hypothetical protein
VRDGRGQFEEMRGSGRPFYRRLGRGWRLAGTGEARCGGDKGGTVVATGRLGADGGEWSPDHSVRGRMVPNFTGERVMARRQGGQWPATIASMPITGDGEGTDGRGPHAREGAGARERGEARLTRGARATVRGEGTRHESGRAGGGGPRAGVREKERGGSGPESAQPRRGRGIFFFFFSISFLVFFSLIPFLL